MTARADGAARCREGEALSSICTVLYLPLEDIKPEGMAWQGREEKDKHDCPCLWCPQQRNKPLRVRVSVRLLTAALRQM